MSNSTSVATGLIPAGSLVIFNGRSIINGYTIPPGGSINVRDGAKVVDSFDNATGTVSVHVIYRQALRLETSLEVDVTGASGAFVFWGAS